MRYASHSLGTHPTNEVLLTCQEVSWDLLSLQDPQTTMVHKTHTMRVTDFELVEAIGAGGYGNVWLARRRRTGD